MPEANLPNIDGFHYQCYICGGDHITEAHVDSIVEDESKAKETQTEETTEAEKAQEAKLEQMIRYIGGLTTDTTVQTTVDNKTLTFRAGFQDEKYVDAAIRGAYRNLSANIASFKNVNMKGGEITGELVHPIGDVKKFKVSVDKKGM